ncbi:MAG: HipA domain-containing protein [Myxococcales bacterium]|nr:HipA domain-containing protein [Myxococcales bacterium]
MSRGRRRPAIDRADVFRGAERAGVVERTPHGSRFTYDAEYLAHHAHDAHGIAFQLPLRAEPFESRGLNLHPFFANLLPEGARLAALVRHVKSSPDDFLSLAVAAGADTIGDVAIVAAGDRPVEGTPVLDTAHLATVSFAELFDRSVEYDDPTRHERMTVPGVQEKISAAMIAFPVRTPRRRGGPQLLKLEPPAFPHLVPNELFFMQAAADAGIEAAHCSLVRDRDGAAGLLVRRFDRRVEADGGLTKIHQEDACQLLDRYPADKYALSLDDLAAALSVCTAAIVAVGALVAQHAYAYVIANGDLHAKNISVLVSPDTGRVEMTPAYDLLSTLPYGDAHMALKVAGRDARLRRRHFVELGARHGVREAAVNAIIDRICDGVAPWIGRLEEIGLPPRATTQLRRTMTQRRDDLR